MTTPDIKLSKALRPLADAIEEILSSASGIAKCPFVLVAQPCENAQYVANIKREDGIAILGGLMARWGNPHKGLPPLPEDRKDILISSLIATARSYHGIVDELMATLVTATANSDTPFMPTQSSFWPDFIKAAQLLKDIEAHIAFARELAEKGAIAAPPMTERH
jgi:hypothetical protein